MTGLVDHHGKPLTLSSNHAARTKPIVGDRLGAWAGRDTSYLQLPGGSMLSFDLDRLTTLDYRAMRNHYQINASLSVLSFILHQIDWQIECDNEEIRDMIEGNLRDQWTMLVRGISQAFWAGYSPMALNYENKGSYVVIDKIKDLVPEECSIKWKKLQGYAPPGQRGPIINKFDGIIQQAVGAPSEAGGSYSINPLNSFWYPFHMENGDHWGKKILKPAFPAWYFSQIIHLFANRYYERFGEPTPVGRAPWDDDVKLENGQEVSGRDAMEMILRNLRNRSTVILPSERDPVTKTFDYDIDYLESQMRGADFERYLSRLDEEMSLAVFTPVLLFRTADVGSYNLGQAHLKIFLWMLNSVAADMKLYIQSFIVDRLREFNFGESAPEASWTFRKLGKDDADIYRQMLMEIVRTGRVMPDLEELGTAVGLTLREVEIITDTGQVPGDGGADPTFPEAPEETGQTPTDPAPSVTARKAISLDAARQVVELAVKRAQAESEKGQAPKFGHRKPLAMALQKGGADREEAEAWAEAASKTLDELTGDLSLAFKGSEFGERLARLANAELAQLVA